MTAQQAPHTPPMWRRFLSLPHTSLGWWAVGLVSIVLILLAIGTFAPGPDPEESVNPPLWSVVLETISVITLLVATLAGGFVGALALGAGERSLLVWFAQVPPAILFVGFFSIFREHPHWVKQISAGVLFWAVMAFSIYWPGRVIFRGSRERSS